MEATETVSTTDFISLAARFVNNTGRHVFLTGKAGTGKTTFLHNLAKATHKNFLIVAPTGIAALNAGGVTIHSQFLLPLGTFLPADRHDYSVPGPFYTREDMARRHPLNSVRKQVLRSIDLLIIDEVSMLRADVLDAVDYRLKGVKGNRTKSFGGVQLLMIGDLHQLPPIVKEQEWAVMKKYYTSPLFFEALALKQEGYSHIELDKIFRQSDPVFIGLLNNLRNDCCTREDIDALNKHYRPDYKSEDGAITLTTHNAQAEQINNAQLSALKAKERKFKATIKGDFPESLFPVSETLLFKEGARVMFVKNDSAEGRYFNGKLATVKYMGEDSIFVTDDDGKPITVQPTTWENKRYALSEGTKELEEDIIGTFSQFPLKLAWAITVHKSQGLTFDKAIIDVGRAFAPGQVYVALSRLRSIDGLILRTPIHQGAISSDPNVVSFSAGRQVREALQTNLQEAQRAFLRHTLRETFDFTEIMDQIKQVRNKMGGIMNFEDAEMRVALHKLNEMLLSENENTSRFQSQIDRLLHEGNYEVLKERIQKGTAYYIDFLTRCQVHLLRHIAEVGTLSKVKTYLTALDEIDQLVHSRMAHILKAGMLATCIAEDREVGKDISASEKLGLLRKELLAKVEAYMKENPKNLSNKTGKKRKSPNIFREPGIPKEKKAKKEKGETYRISLELLQKGMTIEEVAKDRKLAASTIEGHTAKLIGEGKLNHTPYLNGKEKEEILDAIASNKDADLNKLISLLGNKYSYSKLRIGMAVHALEKADKNKEG